MDELDALKPILDSDEIVTHHYRPSKKRYVYLSIISTLFGFIIFLAPMITFAILIMFGFIKNEAGEIERMPSIFFFVMIGIVTIFFISGMVRTALSYKNTIYAITNKRLIVRSGVIGADFQSYNLNSIQGLEVRVDFLDKLVKPNTGSIRFGSVANMSLNTSSNGKNSSNSLNGFRHIENPYDVYKAIKEATGQGE